MRQTDAGNSGRRKGRLDVVKFLLKKGADINVAACYYSDNFVDISAYCVAKANGHDAVADLVRDEGAVIDIYTHAYLGDAKDVGKLLRKTPSLLNRDFRAAPRAKPKYEATPLHYAVAGSHLDVCDLLIGKGAEVNACRGNHNMPDDPSRVIALLDKEANVNVTDHKGKTALHRAAQAGFVKISKVLIEHGADIEAQDAGGETPLFDALKAGRADTVRLLVDHGASTTVKNRRGRAALDIAKTAKRTEIRRLATLLENAKAR